LKHFLPLTRVATVSWLNAVASSLPWECAQGSGIAKFTKSVTVELNVVKTLDRVYSINEDRLDLVVQRLVDNWVNLKVLLGTREQLKEKELLDYVTGEVERILYKANLEVIKKTPHLNRKFTNVAIDSILAGTWNVDDVYSKKYADITRLLKAWRAASTDLENVSDKFYQRIALSGKTKTRITKVVEFDGIAIPELTGLPIHKPNLKETDMPAEPDLTDPKPLLVESEEDEPQGE